MSDESPEVEEGDEEKSESSPASDSENELAAEDADRKHGSNLVYAALGAGALVLALLLLIVWLSSRDDGSNELPLCLDIATDAAADAVLAGNVETIDVLIDQDQPLKGLTAIQLQMTNGECRRLPEGVDNRDGLYQLLGVVSLYNEAGDQQVDVRYLRQDVPGQLLSTSTPLPTETPETSPTTTASPTSDHTSTPTPAPSATATTAPSPRPTSTSSSASPSPISNGSASPPASPSPLASPPASPHPNPTTPTS